MAANEQRSSDRRVLKILWILQGHTLNGLRLKQVADALTIHPSTALRDLELMADEGVAERIPGRDEFWRLTPKLIQLARAHEQEMLRQRQHLDEIDQRYTRTPR